MQPIATLTPDYTPARLRKLMLRLAQLQPGMAYTVTLLVLDDGEPLAFVAELGKVEHQGHRRAGEKVVR
jgi:hypothetical protein